MTLGDNKGVVQNAGDNVNVNVPGQDRTRPARSGLSKRFGRCLPSDALALAAELILLLYMLREH